MKSKDGADTAINVRKMSRGPVKGAVKLFSYGVNGSLLGFLEDMNSRTLLRVFEKSGFSHFWRDLPDMGMASGTVLDFSFKVLSGGTALLEVISQQKDKMIKRLNDYDYLYLLCDQGKISEAELGERMFELFGYGYLE